MLSFSLSFYIIILYNITFWLEWQTYYVDEAVTAEEIILWNLSFNKLTKKRVSRKNINDQLKKMKEITIMDFLYSWVINNNV